MLDLLVSSQDVDEALDLWDGWWDARPLKILGDELARDGRERIARSDRAPDGSAWKPWSESYERTRGPQHKLLVSEGNLRDSIESKSRGDRAEVGSELPYALVHQDGSRDGTIEARPYVGLSRSLERTVDRLIEQDFERRMP